ncbi:hypothetical protein GO998_24140 (plasmid) [Ralstonia syzygii]|uniref:Uncharacterized protein n=1 Tax=Ralstonia syzygii TaxID=28097 RepID=A0ABX7ZNI8_9RALS|nr:hypothetical protein GO998_24140 [Ralstonia syzygii]
MPHHLVHEKGLVQFAAVARWSVQGGGASDASQHNGADERISIRKINIDNEKHKKPSKLAHRDETRVGPQGDVDVIVNQMVNLLKGRMLRNGNPDEVAEAEEIRDALAEHQFPESLVYEAKHFGLRTEENRAAVVARFYEWAADDAELAEDAAQHEEHPATHEAR